MFKEFYLQTPRYIFFFIFPKYVLANTKKIQIRVIEWSPLRNELYAGDEQGCIQFWKADKAILICIKYLRYKLVEILLNNK